MYMTFLSYRWGLNPHENELQKAAKGLDSGVVTVDRLQELSNTLSNSTIAGPVQLNFPIPQNKCLQRCYLLSDVMVQCCKCAVTREK